jgi:hypothetical protein
MIGMTGSPLQVRTGFSIQAVGSETLIYDETRHEAFCLDATASAVWRLCDGTMTLARISERVSAELDRGITEDVVRVTLGDLERRGLLVADAATVLPDASRRDLLRRMGVGAALMVPAIAMIAAPKAAQAYNGCVDCTPSNRNARRRGGSL